MSYNNLNSTTENTAENIKNSVDKSTDDNIKDNICSDINTNYKFNMCKTDALNNKIIFEKGINDINEAVSEECCKCDSIDDAVSPPHFENTAEDADKATLWLNKNNRNYNFVIEHINYNNENNCNEKTISASDKIAHEKGILVNANINDDKSLHQADNLKNSESSSEKNTNQTDDFTNNK